MNRLQSNPHTGTNSLLRYPFLIPQIVCYFLRSDIARLYINILMQYEDIISLLHVIVLYYFYTREKHKENVTCAKNAHVS